MYIHTTHVRNRLGLLCAAKEFAILDIDCFESLLDKRRALNLPDKKQFWETFVVGRVQYDVLVQLFPLSLSLSLSYTHTHTHVVVAVQHSVLV